MYYLRSRPAVDAIKFTVDQEMLTRKISLKYDKVIDPNMLSKVSITKTFDHNQEDQDDQMK